MKGDNTPNSTGVYGTQGIASATNKPGARVASVAWSEALETAGKLWLFGGVGNITFSDADYFNDLWSYDIDSNQWTWIKRFNASNSSGMYGIQGIASATNNPGVRSNSVAWKDNHGDFWAFGGYGQTGTSWGYLNDLWKYNISANQWTWVKGDSTLVYYGKYGEQGIPSANNRPGDRVNAVGWSVSRMERMKVLFNAV